MQLGALFDLVRADPQFRRLAELLPAPGTPGNGSKAQTIVGPAAMRPFVAAVAAADRPVLLVTANGREAEELAATVADLLGPGVVASFPSWETLPHERLSPGADTIGRRLAVLRRLAHPEDTSYGPPLRVIVAAARSLVQPLAPGLGDTPTITLRVGDELDFDELLEKLTLLAYGRVDMVGKRGEFAVRGGIVDVFPNTAEFPVRLEFFGDELAEIRAFSVADQRSQPEVSTEIVHIHPSREILLTAAVRERAAKLTEHYAETGHQALGELLEKLAAGVPADGMEALIPELVDGDMVLLPELLPPGSPVLVCDPEKVARRAEDLAKTGEEFLAASWQAAAMASTGAAIAPIGDLDLSESAYRSLAQVREATPGPWWELTPLGSGADHEITLDLQAAPSPRGSETEIAQLFSRIAAFVRGGGKAALIVAGGGTAHRYVERLREADVPVHLVEGPFEKVPPAAEGAIVVARGNLGSGMELPSSDLLLLAESDLTGNRVAAMGDGKRLPAKRRNTVDPLALTAGDMVVHDQHGIGKFVEMIERTIGGARREYLVIEYAAGKRGQPGDRLFVPMDALDQLSRYVGGEAPALSKLGGSDWQNTKRKARKAVREIAGELVQLYAARQAAPGHAFAPDSVWQREMEDAFGFTETMDQLTVIAEVKADMERPVPMDRVIIGDVGYGKTEIAVRAAFKAVQDGKQVAVLVPTTLLAGQHLQTFSERMAGFPVTVRGLSRFTDPAESKQVLEGLRDGSVDIVVGTHRLLQTGVVWRDLGLVVVDEEQRFGVDHKEHIKALRTHVDVLTMSATPIPRTLEMSMAGIREMSMISTPPEERHPVLTYVGGYDTKQVAAAIRRELLRDGQVFFVHNRVSSIDKTAAALRALIPEARIVVAHGQMGEEQLEQTVQGFWNRDFDVLVCTTIIETGLDISNANTLIVDRSENLGLSQLHQLRGRVGRSRERGYAYFLYAPEKSLTETAYDRLVTIAQNSDLGAGMAVAMKDLELRGAGNVLGQEQSGHVAGVGFDLYVRLVGEAVQAYRAAVDGTVADGAAVDAEPAEVRLDLPVDAHIPPDYVTSDRLRLEGYRKFASATDPVQIEEVMAELTDRYGTPPAEVLRLAALARLRLEARRFGVTEIAAAGTNLRISPLDLADSAQIRLKRLFPNASYRATTHAITMPLPRTGGIGSDRVRDLDLVQAVADFLTAMHGEAPTSITGE